MGRMAPTLLLTAVVAVVLGVVGLAATPGLVSKTSGEAATSSEVKDTGAPEGYGSK